MYSLNNEIFVQQRASFESFPVTKPVVIQGTMRYKEKDLDIIIFPLIPLIFLWVKWFGYWSLSKSSIFSKSWKHWKLTNFFNTFFKWPPFLEKPRYWHETKDRCEALNTNFFWKKADGWQVKPLLRYSSLKIGPHPVCVKTKMDFLHSLGFHDST